ncbi:MAG: exo-alpha-sialidase [candidate division Zixibacteria bacterium]|nr:exo-alpha-sialidase [candidate division Zixibacteria bacterium]
MQKKITDTTAAFGLGDPYQAKLFRVSSGTYLDRRAVVIQTSPTEIKLAWSDAPSSGWSSLVNVASDATDNTFDAVMTADGDIHVAYTEQSTSYLVTRKLTFSGGTWSAGARVTIYNGAYGYDPSLAVEPGGNLWVSFCRFVSPTRWVQTKSSTDGGATWGSGSADAGDQISTGSMFAWSQCLVDDYSVHVIFNDQDTALSICSQALSGGSWSSQYNIATGSAFGRNFHAAIGCDNRLGVTYYRDQLYYREYDGNNWGAVVVLETEMVTCPQLLFKGNVPAVVYLRHIGNNLKVAQYTDRRTGTFSGPEVLDRRVTLFDAVLLYDASSDSYENLTTEASGDATADVYHSSSGCLVKDAGDILYLGMDARFRLARLVLSTPGVGGTLLVSYWDGTNWQAFTPANGSTDLGSGLIDLLLWTDFSSMPDDWQKLTVNSQTRFWVKLEVGSVFTTGPVGSQISAGSETNRMIFRRQ